MLKSEDGFTLLDGLVSFSFLLLVASLLFPLLFRMIDVLSEGKKELTAYRLLYEQVEESIWLNDWENRRLIRENIEYVFSFHDVQEKKKACVTYESKTVCMEQ
ncbi:type II secretion system GspH family protein [Siminovitchia sp. FSL H7-0308]|uniref:Type II secretion system protein n=1 Tax=Siminovitchia thermophila TaxID=1245522 RepID=A0ABS2R2D8_9BACI|nr:type II secretion system GspH family protein [Siminovitchia thermophila]MBM7713798.1 hypothetical protein [Siminovitchia thermophila]